MVQTNCNKNKEIKKEKLKCKIKFRMIKKSHKITHAHTKDCI